MSITVECQKRPQDSKPNALRRQGLIPAALYGHNGTESVSLVLPEKDATTLLRHASINNTLVELSIPDLSWKGKVLIREVQAHPWKKNLYHLSFFSVATHDSIDAVIPLNLVGEAPGVKQGGILEQMLTELQVKCAPERLPETIDINVSNLDIGSSMTINDLVLPEGVTPLEVPETLVLSLLAPTVAPEDVAEASTE